MIYAYGMMMTTMMTIEGGDNMIALLAMIHLKYEEFKAAHNGKNPYVIQAEEIMKLINDIKYSR